MSLRNEAIGKKGRARPKEIAVAGLWCSSWIPVFGPLQGMSLRPGKEERGSIYPEVSAAYKLLHIDPKRVKVNDEGAV